jgi:hypothetical protein
MTQYEQLLTTVTSNVQDDAARLAFAAHIRNTEPDRAHFIEDQIEGAKRRRAQRGHVYVAEHPLLRTHGAAWSRMIAKYTRRWIFDRGFIAKVEMEPYMFLEYGEWLMLNYPIQVVELRKPDSGTFPTAELADSPLLAKLEGLAIRDVKLENADVERLVTSPHLERIQYLVVSNRSVDAAIYDMVAASPRLRGILALSLEGSGPGQRYADTGRDDMQGRAVHAWTDLSSKGKELEQKYGYLPWLHPEDNWCEPLDAAWFVAQGILPVKASGTPVT